MFDTISITNCVKYQPISEHLLLRNEDDEVYTPDYKVIGEVLTNKTYAYVTHDSWLEVINIKTGHTISSWNFGYLQHDLTTKVIKVAEIQQTKSKIPLLAVALQSELINGTLCIFDFCTTCVLRSILIREPITSVHVIDAGFSLPGPLSIFDGIVAVGVEGGSVYLIDINKQICEERDETLETRNELNPYEMMVIPPKDVNKIEEHKQIALGNNKHLAIHLNFVDKITEHFVFKGQNGDDRLNVNKVEVAVSAIYYCTQLGSLLVGFNFGAFQLFNLINLELVYASPVSEEYIPITRFAFQEPADDPRAFCYIWAIYSAYKESSILPLAVMYSFCYDSKEYHEGYGYLYEKFNTASIYYQMELGLLNNLRNSKSKVRHGYCLALQSNQEQVNTKISTHCGHKSIENKEENLVLCFMAWCIEMQNGKKEIFICVFDLNQWYKEQMPKVLNPGLCANYFFQMRLENDKFDNNFSVSSNILSVSFDENSITSFIAPQRLEEHYCPNSITFDLVVFHENNLTFLRKQGVQKAILNKIKSDGTLALIEPAKYYQEVVSFGLVPLFIDLLPNTPIPSIQQREIIFNILLENNICNLLCKCVDEWANGCYLSAGCSLDLLINWALQRAIVLKSKCFDICVTLFDHSGQKLDGNATKLFYNSLRQLNTICKIFNYISETVIEFIPNVDQFKSQMHSIKKVKIYYQVLRWFYDIGLLPECSFGKYSSFDESDNVQIPYPINVLLKFYTSQREVFTQIGSNNSILFIDNLIQFECCASDLKQQWKNDGGDGVYPPPSIQALLKSYVLPEVQNSKIHLLVTYFCLDLVAALRENIYKSATTYLNKFSDCFGVSLSIFKIVQAFWYLDHGDSKNAVETILDPMIKKLDMKGWYHKVMIRSLLLQNQNNYALYYVQVMKPPVEDDEDIMNTITLFISNHMLDEAITFKNHSLNSDNEEKILVHFYEECAKNDRLKSIIHSNITEREESIFLSFLQKNSNQIKFANLLVSYHLIRNEYLEAFNSNAKLNRSNSVGLFGQSLAAKHDRLVHQVKNNLSSICMNMIDVCQQPIFLNETRKPTPMSTFFTNKNEHSFYNSNVIGAAISKAREIFCFEDYQNKLRTRDVPFLCKPKFKSDLKSLPRVVKNPKLVANFSIKLDTLEENKSDGGVSPPKKLKLSMRDSINLSFNSIATSSILDTPLIKRRLSYVPSEIVQATPHSILKTRSETSRNLDYLQAKQVDNATPVRRKSVFNESPSKSFSKLSAVRFECISPTFSSSSTPDTSFNGSKSLSLDHNLKNSSNEDENKFYSPEISNEESTEKSNNSQLDTTLESVNQSLQVRKGIKRVKSPIEVRSSPRLSSKIEQKESIDLKRTKIRKSLCRKVLETNALREIINEPVEPAGKDDLIHEMLMETANTSIEPNTEQQSKSELIHESTLVEKLETSETLELIKDPGDHMQKIVFKHFFVSDEKMNKSSIRESFEQSIKLTDELSEQSIHEFQNAQVNFEHKQLLTDSKSTSESSEKFQINLISAEKSKLSVKNVVSGKTKESLNRFEIDCKTKQEVDESDSPISSLAVINEDDGKLQAIEQGMEVDDTDEKIIDVNIYNDLSNSQEQYQDNKSDIVEFDDDLMNFEYENRVYENLQPLEETVFTSIKDKINDKNEVIEISSSSDKSESTSKSSSSSDFNNDNKELETGFEDNINESFDESESSSLISLSSKDSSQNSENFELVDNLLDEGKYNQEVGVKTDNLHATSIVKTDNDNQSEAKNTEEEVCNKDVKDNEIENHCKVDKKKKPNIYINPSVEFEIDQDKSASSDNVKPKETTSSKEPEENVTKKIPLNEIVLDSPLSDNLSLIADKTQTLQQNVTLSDDKLSVKNIRPIFATLINTSTDSDAANISVLSDITQKNEQTRLKATGRLFEDLDEVTTVENPTIKEDTNNLEIIGNIVEDYNKAKYIEKPDNDIKKEKKKNLFNSAFIDYPDDNQIGERNVEFLNIKEESVIIDKTVHNIFHTLIQTDSSSSNESKLQSTVNIQDENSKTTTQECGLFEENYHCEFEKEATNTKIETNNETPEVVEPLRRVLRSRTISTEAIDSPKTPRKSRVRRNSAEVVDSSNIAAKRTRSTRSKSTEDYSDSETIRSEKSAAESITRSKTKRVASIQPQLTAINEESNDKVEKNPTNSLSAIDDYAQSRRMTRRQKTLMQKTNEVEKLEMIDPIVLLEREPFDGVPDPDEKRIYEEESSPSSSTASLVAGPKGKTIKRPRSQASVTSVGTTAGRKRVTRKISTESSGLANENEMKSSGPVRRSTRTNSRAGSVASDKSDISTSRSKRGTKK